MSERHQEHEEALEEYAQDKTDAAFMRIYDELDLIEDALNDDAAGRVVLKWVRMAVQGVAKEGQT